MTARKTTRPLCSIEGCSRPHRARGWCGAHYERWRRNGDPTVYVKPPRTVEERFWEKVTKTDSCWLWTGVLSRGYGLFSIDGRDYRSHRVAYEMLVGPIPEGLQIDHLCRTRACVNPAHLEPVTQRENVLRGVGPSAINARKTHCVHGHPLSGDNLFVQPGYGRVCRTCKRLYQQKKARAA